jgi:hypothetical protein
VDNYNFSEPIEFHGTIQKRGRLEVPNNIMKNYDIPENVFCKCKIYIFKKGFKTPNLKKREPIYTE